VQRKGVCYAIVQYDADNLGSGCFLSGIAEHREGSTFAAADNRTKENARCRRQRAFWEKRSAWEKQ
jgi:hypothetical protein